MGLKIEMKTRERGRGVWESKDRLSDWECGVEVEEKWRVSHLFLKTSKSSFLKLFHTQSHLLFPVCSSLCFYSLFTSSFSCLWPEFTASFSSFPACVSFYRWAVIINSVLPSLHVVFVCLPISEQEIQALMLSWCALPWSACIDRSCCTALKPSLPLPVPTKKSCLPPLLMSFFFFYMVITISFTRGWWPGGDIIWKQTCCVPSLMF